MENPHTRESRVAVDLMEQTPYRDCVGGEYGDEETDYSTQEIKDDDEDVYGYHDSLRPTNVTITGS